MCMCKYVCIRFHSCYSTAESEKRVGDDNGIVCLLQKNNYVLASASKYVHSPCSYIGIRHLGPYRVWVALNSRCNLSRDASPFQSNNSFVVVQANADSYRGISHDYHSCWNERKGRYPPDYFTDDDGDIAFTAGHLFCCPTGGQIGHTGKVPVVFKL
ncbi:uncharacterized protein LOC134189063 isoform X2 [Corticium candelabrum]|uniref:uncharacterized protein LOC134189063 isoform X2 n=1 Tax=Corticium candelabrum TaxID=121492 RepID=UPI002E276ADA|nr:uncharacterized protein LOC134189063 isoform X2 [Corticium candelabrum]